MTEDFFIKSLEVGKVFTPTAPIDERSLFSGRQEQIQQVVDVVLQKGQHAMLFGERGVGKTSLSNVISSYLASPEVTILSPRVNCDSMDSFESVFQKAFGEIQLKTRGKAIGFGRQTPQEVFSATDFISSGVTPDSVRKALTLLSEYFTLIIIFDEFDRLGEEVKTAFADTIKSLSDHAVPTTIILVGVADSIDQLIKSHQSVERALVQIRIPRMSKDEIIDIINKGMQHLELDVDNVVLEKIAVLAQGLPHYAHLLGQHTARRALEMQSPVITQQILDEAISKALDASQQSIRSAYHKATMSPRKDNLFSDVLLACALARTDDLGFFAAQDVREPIRWITGKNYEIPSFSQHLNEFSEEKRGPVLQKIGTPRRFRFRFINPLMQPFVIMKGFTEGKVNLDASVTVSRARQ